MKEKKWDVFLLENKSTELKKDAQFFTSDTDAQLSFEVKDEEFTVEAANITLFNLQDGSVVNESMEVSGKEAKYPIRAEVIARSGRWVAQVIFTSGGEEYTAESSFFYVEGHLLDKDEPRIQIIGDFNRTIKTLVDIGLDEKYSGLERQFAQAAEVEAARGQFSSLSQRLNSQDEKIAEIPTTGEPGGGTPRPGTNYKEVFETLSELTSFYPQGDSNKHAVLFDGMIYTYTNRWESTGLEAEDTEVVASLYRVQKGVKEVNTEIKKAKGKYPGLAERMNSEYLLLSEGLNQVDEGVKNLVGEVKAARGSTPPDRSVSLAKTTFSKVGGKNLFNKATITPDGYVSDSNGGIITDANFVTSDYIPVLPNTTYTKTTGHRYAFYDVNKAFISGGNKAYTFTSPANAVFVRVSTTKTLLDTFQVEVGGIATGYEPYYEVIDKKHIESLNTLTSVIGFGKNLFNGKYLEGVMVFGYAGTQTGMLRNVDYDNMTPINGRVMILPVKGNTSYAISKESSNRFVVAVATDYPTFQEPNLQVLKSDVDGTDNEFVLTTRSTDKFLLVGVARNNEEKPFLQVEEGSVVTDWEAYGYKFLPEAKPIFDNTGGGGGGSLYVNVKDHGALGDGVTDDSNALQRVFDQFKGKTIIIPAGTYVVTKTLFINSGTTLIGEGHATQILLGDGFALSSVDWRGTPAYPILMTRENTSNVTVKAIRITGNRTTYKTSLQWGFCFFGCVDGIAEDVEVEYINYFQSLQVDETGGMASGGIGWGFVVYKSKDVLVRGGKSTHCGYECYGIERSENVTFDNVYSGVGWRTSFQIHRGSKNIKVIGGNVIQNEPNAHSAFTIHGALADPLWGVLVDGVTIHATVDPNRVGRGGLQAVNGGEYDVTVTNCTIESNNVGITAPSNRSIGTGDSYDWIIKDNRITSLSTGVTLNGDGNIVKDNIIDSVGTAISQTGNGYIVKDNILKNNKSVVLSGTAYA